MKTLSFPEYQNNNEQNVYQLKDKLVALGNIIPKNLFVKTAINAAKSVQHLVVRQQDRQVYSEAIEMAEAYLRGEATPEQCRNAAANAASYAADYAASYAAASYAAASASAADYASYYAANAASYAASAADYAAYAAANAASYADFVANASYAANVFVRHEQQKTALDIFREGMPWNIVCAAQIAAATINHSSSDNNEQLIEQLSKNTQLIDYATVILSQEDLREEFEFLMKAWF